MDPGRIAIKRFRKLKHPAKVSEAELSKALDHIRGRVAGEIALREIVAKLEARTTSRASKIEELEAELPLNVEIATALLEAGKITEAEAIFYCSFHITALHDRYFMDGNYDTDLKEITAKMEQIERENGLASDQYWLRHDAPIEYQHELERHDAVLKRKQNETFRKFAPDWIVERLEGDPEQFWKLYELGRRSVFEKDDHLASVIDVVELYEGEANKSADAGAYYSAIAMLGSASEARILLECIREPTRTQAAILCLPGKDRPASSDPLRWTLANLINIAQQADWLPNIEDGSIIHVVSGWVHRLRVVRNLLHPGRHILERPHVTLGRQEWLDALAAYTALRHSIETARRTVRLKTRTKTARRRPSKR